MHHQYQPQVKTWWGPVWRGLVVDKEASHYHKIRGALWLFLYLVVHANRRTGQLYRKPVTIAADMGVSRRTVHRWLERLQRHGYITISYRDRTQVIHIQKWRSALSLNKKDKMKSESDKSGVESGQTMHTRELSTGKSAQR